MTTKKILCLLLCICLCFTLLSGPWRAEAEAAGGVASIVLAIVGTFVVSAGFSFATKGEFQTATEAFMTSDAARYVTNITDYVSDIFSLNNATNIYDLAPLITSDWFQSFWQAIRDFFGDGEVVLENKNPSSSAPGYSIYGSVELPTFNTPSNYTDWVYHFLLYNPSTQVYTMYINYYEPFNRNNWLYTYNGGSVTNTYWYNLVNDVWTRTGSKSQGLITPYVYFTEAEAIAKEGSILVWSNFDFYTSSNTNTNSHSSLWFNGSPAIGYDGSITSDVIGVIEDTSIYPPDVYTGWVDKASEGSIDWALDSSSVYQDVTSSDTTSSMTSTQSGVLTDTGVKVDTIEKTMGEYAVSGLTSLFPFCIPFDVYNFFAVLTAEREAPKFEFNLSFGDLGTYPVAVDLSDWETVAAILRTVELLGFCIGLALATSKLIKW